MSDDLVKRVVGKTWHTVDSEGKRWADDAPPDLARAYIAQAARIADLERQLAEAREVKPLEWVEGLHETRDDDGGPREGVLRRLWAWRASGYLIIQQDGDRGLFILRGKSDGIGLVVPTLEAAKAAAQADYEARILSALKGTP